VFNRLISKRQKQTLLISIERGNKHFRGPEKTAFAIGQLRQGQFYYTNEEISAKMVKSDKIIRK
jgi:hypothetical protein